MKHLTTLACSFVLLMLSYTALAQNNLEFSQVINQDISVVANGSTDYITNTITLTVPAGKVWKVESASVSEKYTGSTYSYHSLGGTLMLHNTIIGRQNNNFSNGLPFWLSEGDHDLILQGGTSSSSYSWFGHLSIIEFNVVAQ